MARRNWTRLFCAPGFQMWYMMKTFITSSLANSSMANAPLEARRSASKTLSKCHWKPSASATTRGSKQLWRDQSGGHLFAVAQSPIKPTGLLQLSNAAKTGKAEPLSLRQQPPSTVRTAPEPFERGLASQAISAPTGTDSPSPRMIRWSSSNWWTNTNDANIHRPLARYTQTCWITEKNSEWDGTNYCRAGRLHRLLLVWNKL